MTKHEILLNGNRVFIFDVPEETLSMEVAIYDGLNVIFKRGSKKMINKISHVIAIDVSKSDTELSDLYSNRIINMGKLNFQSRVFLEELFEVVKRGNFYEYLYNGVHYTSSLSAFEHIISNELNVKNPYILIIKPNLNN